METKKLTLLESDYHCQFCFEMTFGPPGLTNVLCRNCGLDTDDSDDDSPRRTLEPPRLPFQPPVEEPVRRALSLKRVLLIGGAAVGVTAVVGVGAVVVPSLLQGRDATPPVAAEEARESVSLFALNARHTQVDVAGWEETPVWAVASDDAQALPSIDGDTVLVGTPNEATVLDATTGDVITQHVFTTAGETRLSRTSDTFVVVHDATLLTWRSDTDWNVSDIASDATLATYGTSLVTVSADGVIYDATSDKRHLVLNPATSDATLVGATSDTLVWLDGSGVIVAKRGVENVAVMSRATLATPGDATLIRVHGTDESHVYATWRRDGHTLIATHDINDGSTISTLDVVDETSDATFFSTPDQSFHAFGNVTIDARTGAATLSDGVATGIVGERFVLQGEEHTLIFDPATEKSVAVTLPDESTVIGGSDTQLLLSTSEGVLALTKTPKKDETK